MSSWNGVLLSKWLTLAGGVAFTMLGIAIYRNSIKRAAQSNRVKEWENEKATLQKDKELLEQKLFELENILERMSKEIENLKASIKDKQKVASTQEAEKERLQEQERRNRRESETTIEQLQRRAQHFLRELEAKSLLCDSQSNHIALLEATNKQLLQEKQLLDFDLDKQSTSLHQQATMFRQHDESLQQQENAFKEITKSRDQAVLDIKYLLSNFFAFKRPASSPNLETSKITPLLVGLESTQEPTLVAICKRYTQSLLDGQQTFDSQHLFDGHEDGIHPTSTNSQDINNGNKVSFSVSVEGTKTGALVATHM